MCLSAAGRDICFERTDMGLLDRLFGRKPQQGASQGDGAPGAAADKSTAQTAAAPDVDGAWQPHPVQQQLIEAVRDNKQVVLRQLCEQHREVIKSSFADWRRVPREARKDKAIQEAYVQAHVAVARCFANELGDASLLQMLVGKPKENPVDQWRIALERTQIAIDAGEFARARDLLEDVLARMEGCEGSAIDVYQPTAKSLLAICLFELRHAEQAVEPLTEAIESARQNDDLKGQIAFTGNLYEVYRYLGQDIAASECASNLSEMMAEDDNPMSRWFASQAKLIEKGEPKLRVVAVINDVYYELKGLPARTKDARINLVYQRNRAELKPCVSLCNKGQNLLNHQKFHEAIDVFRSASDLDTYAPMPAYLAGIALLHLQEYEPAIDAFNEVNRLAPGWYQNGTFLWLANQLHEGELSHDTFVALQMIESGMGSREERLDLVDAAIGRNPEVPSLYLQKAILLDQLGRRDEAKALCNKGLDFAREEPDAGSRLLLQLAQMAEPNSDEQYDLYERVGKVKGGHLIAKGQARVAVGTIR